MLTSFLAALPIIGVAIFGAWMVRWQFAKADRMLDNWARENGYTISKKRSANVGDGPMGARQATHAVKYRVTVADQAGHKRSGIIRLGSLQSGTLSDEVSMEWDN